MPGIKFLPALGKPNVAWVFKGEDYGTIEWAPGSVPGVVLQSTESIFYNWPSLREAGFIRVDAAVNMYDEAWIFYGNKMAAITIPNNNSDSMLTQGPYPLSEWDSLKELGFTSIDALHAVPNHPGEYFVFSGLNYARICRSRHVDKVISGPKPILEN
ncbi:hypothetical protein FRC09_000068 [Ceratobasidium sp. 395]|nr:hypothetical protein FRC09_000068 [Ceratobasidium sp. 395]